MASTNLNVNSVNEINGDVNGVVSKFVCVAVNTTATTTQLDNNST